MYMLVPRIFQKILNHEMPGLTSMVFCFEDACPEGQVEEAEKNVIHVLDVLSTALDNGELTYEDLPLIFWSREKSGTVYPFRRTTYQASCKGIDGDQFS